MAKEIFIRTRFAPSPTGPLHIGGVRTALFNYLYAKKNGGEFILRIEDTDSKRTVPGAEDYILKSLVWCGIIPDLGLNPDGTLDPKFRQSNRSKDFNIYRGFVEKLIMDGKAYFAFDTPEELKKIRESEPYFSYGPKTRLKMKNSLRTPDICKCAGDPNMVVRFMMPEIPREIVVHDQILGDIVFSTKDLDDKVIWKYRDSLPTYHLANVVDDHLMGITDVIRGDEWITSTPLHLLIYEALGWTPPRFAHVPLILKPEGPGKLSKRDGDKFGFPVFPLEWHEGNETWPGFRDSEYLPEAFINLLAFLGWNPGKGDNREIMTMDELVSSFSLEGIGKHGCRFNKTKSEWFQKEYFQKEDPYKLAAEFKKKYKVGDCLDYVHEVVLVIKSRCTFLSDLWEHGKYFFQGPSERKIPEDQEFINMFVNSYLPEEKTTDEIEKDIESICLEKGKDYGKVMDDFRYFITGNKSGLRVGDYIRLLGMN